MNEVSVLLLHVVPCFWTLTNGGFDWYDSMFFDIIKKLSSLIYETHTHVYFFAVCAITAHPASQTFSVEFQFLRRNSPISNSPIPFCWAVKANFVLQTTWEFGKKRWSVRGACTARLSRTGHRIICTFISLTLLRRSS